MFDLMGHEHTEWRKK